MKYRKTSAIVKLLHGWGICFKGRMAKFTFYDDAMMREGDDQGFPSLGGLLAPYNKIR
jgi:hypothetical protein